MCCWRWDRVRDWIKEQRKSEEDQRHALLSPLMAIGHHSKKASKLQYTFDSTQCSGDEVAHALLDSGGGRGYSGGGGYRGGGGGGGGGRRRRGSGGAVVKARGLPFSTTEYELAGFFEEYDVRDLVT